MTTQVEISQNALLVKETGPFTALCFTTQATLQTIEQYNGVPEQLYVEAERLGVQPTGPIQYVYTGVNGDETNEFRLEIALPVQETAGAPNGLAYKTFEPFRCVSYTYRGAWDTFMAVYDALFAQFHRHGYQTDGRVREVYAVVDFEDRDNCVTEFQIGLV